MASLSLNSSLLISTFFLLVPFFTTPARGTAVTDVCPKTKDPNFCLRAFTSDPRSATADAYGLGKISIDLATAYATDTLDKLLIIVRAIREDTPLKVRLDICADAYDFSRDALEEANRNYDDSFYMGMKQRGDSALGVIQGCNITFAEPPNPLSIQNHNFERLLDIVSTLGVVLNETMD
ncbi:hypothetical protein RJ640_027603 [Escallonia rubra]|uniref:Pectinesterase inhibitor domain-containing protein n=1 Tax=Escallonia rubra TaxID=112253 RepID=A0AA88U901_9ASTE|nr:hypothetical protein RJ640_027603 [Escallonia rubra]